MVNKNVKIGLHILVAEDDDLNRMLFGDILDKYGCTFEVAENGRVAVELFRKGSFHAVFMDLHMPEMNGYEAASTIREIDSLRGTQTPIAVLSGEAFAGGKQVLWHLFDYELQKPFYPEDVAALLQSIALIKPRKKSQKFYRFKLRVTATEKGSVSPYSEEKIRDVLKKMDFDSVFFTLLLEKFKESSAEAIHSIWQALREGDSVTVARKAHNLKGELSIFNSNRGVKLAEILERIAGDEGDTDPTPIITELETELELIVHSFSAYQEK